MSYRYELQVMDSKTVYPDGEKRVAVLPTAHQKSWDVNDRLIKAKAVALTEDHDNVYHGQVISQRNDGVNAWVTVEMDHPIPDDVVGVSPGFVPTEQDENGLVKAFYYDHITLARKTNPVMPFSPEQIRIIRGTKENDDMSPTKEELEAEMKVHERQLKKMEKQLEDAQAKMEELQKSHDEKEKALKEKLKAESDRNSEYELREKKKLLADLPDAAKVLFGENEEEQLKASVKELERAVAMTKVTKPEEAVDNAASGDGQESSSQDEKGPKIKLPPGVAPPENTQPTDPKKAELLALQELDRAARVKFRMVDPSDESYKDVDVKKHEEFFRTYNVNG